jgi:glycosyltransferase involved in cell wall biosynthesis
MACGLPVICSDGGGNRELVTDGETGFVVAPADAHHLANRLLWLKDNPEESMRMGATGRVAVAEHFMVAKMVSQMIAIYDEARAATRKR